MIIDIHSHVFLAPQIKGQFNETLFLSAEQQIKIMDQEKIDKAVILPLNNAESPVEHQSFGEILHICEKYPGRFIPFCNVDPRLPHRIDKIKTEHYIDLFEQYKNLGAKGIGEVTARIYWDHPLMLKFLSALELLNLPLLFHTTTEDFDCYGVLDYLGLELLEGVLKKFPKLNFLGHSAAFWSEISGDLRLDDKDAYPGGKVIPGGAVPRLMKQYPNLYGDISAGSGLNALQRDPVFGWQFIDQFQDRLLLGLDYCSIKNDMQHIEWLTKAKEDGNISIEAYEKITWKNANRVLDLGI